MYLVAHQDACQMVIGTPPIGTLENVFNPVIGEYMEVIVGTQQPRQCTCEPMLVQLELRNGSDEYPHYRLPKTMPL